MDEPGRIGVALFGFGRAGNIHAANIMKSCRAELLYVIDLEVARVKESIREKFHTKNVEVLPAEHCSRVFEDDKVQGVVVCSPTYTHEDIVKTALRHGKMVMCEKPIAETEEAVRICYDTAKVTANHLLCSFNRRFDPSVRSIRDRVNQGEIGDIHSIKTCNRDHPLPPIAFLKISGGMFHDCAVHDIDMICWILGEYPETVYTQAVARDASIAALDDVDTVSILMRFPSRVLATIDLSRHACYGYDQRLEVFGAKGMLVSEHQYPTGVQAHAASGTHLGRIKHSFTERYAESYMGALDHFFDVIQGRAQCEVSSQETVSACRVAAACEQSHSTGLPVTVSYRTVSENSKGK